MYMHVVLLESTAHQLSLFDPIISSHVYTLYENLKCECLFESRMQVTCTLLCDLYFYENKQTFSNQIEGIMQNGPNVPCYSPVYSRHTIFCRINAPV